MMTKNSAIIFRKTLLPYSETFVVKQAEFLPSLNPFFLGYKINSTGYKNIQKHSHLILKESIRAKLNLALGLGLTKKTLNEINSNKPKVIHAHFGNNGYSAIKLAQQLNVPLITSFHGYDITKNTIPKRELKKLFDQGDKFIAVSNFIKNKLLQANCPETKIKQHYIGIDVDYFNAEKKETEQPSILFVGRLTEKKGAYYLIEAFKKISKVFPEAILNIVGDGPLKKDLLIQASSNANIHFLGKKNAYEIKNLLQSSWLFCTPSITAKNGDQEGLGMVFLEAQAMKTPAISFNSGGTVEAIAHEKTGFNLPEKDIDMLSDTLKLMISNNQLRHHMGNNARDWVVDNFDIRKQCKKLEAIYLETN